MRRESARSWLSGDVPACAERDFPSIMDHRVLAANGARHCTRIAASRSEMAEVDMPDRFDVVVAGAGHNSLIAAAYLAKAGYRCLVLEGRPGVGGNCVTEELTLPGFQHDSCGPPHVVIQDSPMLRNDELGL